MGESLLPLFPLQVVLFPRSSLPLTIFEERYKTLVAECLAKKGEFGITLVHENKLSEIGCTAVIVQVVRKYSDGRMDIIVEGKRRFKLTRYESDRAPYLVGTVEFLRTPREETDGILARETIELYNKLVAIVYNQRVPQLDPDLFQGEVSYVLAQKAGMDILQRQKLLESGSENDRLRMLRDYFKDVLPKLERIDEVERVIKGDGYL